ncbi:alpha-2 adrenergic receptor isoform X2 [Lutzomyia longipalpis]|uniref:alpha-2 adrenergic receptor isoform X2 n=1 Tax=Lutzomyia longipalpis TaxID=7200 RepID=UPI0024841C58|nr:alpha-2 adrenergic receptor isoform X2 [Lutzomyia longipalpis]
MEYPVGNITNEDFLAMIGNASGFGQAGVAGGGNDSYINGTLSPLSTTTAPALHGTYPSGYTIAHIVFASIVVTILMVIIVVGNMLVIIAIATEKSLKNIQNWFIASLAVADFFLGLVIMPFSLANELMGYWVFGAWWCDIHSAMDVLLCTSSIMNLCLISLDRYWSITKAVEYLKTRTPARAAIMITAVWIMSGLICIPPLLGWKAKQPEGPLPQCQLSEDLGYVLYSALGSFYIPSCIMVFVYIRIYFAAKRRARRGIKKPPRKSATNEQVTSFTTSPCKAGTRPMPSVPSTAPNTPQQMQPAPPKLEPSISTIDARTNPAAAPAAMSIPVVTCDFASDVSTSEACDTVDPNYGKDTLKVSTIVTTHSPMIRPSSNGTTTSNDLASPTTAGRCRALSVGIDTDMVSEFDPSSSDSGVHHRKKNPPKNTIAMHKPSVGVMELEPAIPKLQKQRDPEKEKRRIARKKEKRATLILGLIMGSFIACWLPFFFLYILTPLCTKCQIPESAFAIAFWLGYMNSALNPAIYTIFNKDFRRAFRRILFK